LDTNTALPWNEALIDRYADRWNWYYLSENAGLPWSHTLYARFADRWNADCVARHYDGNVRSLTPEQVNRLMRYFCVKK
jgi:hypothetical protein